MPPSMFCAALYGSRTPRLRAVPGINCMRPCAPAFDRAVRLNPDSCLMTAAIRSGSTLYFAADLRIRAAIADGA